MKGEFYQMEYEAWDEGTDGLTLEQEAAYLRLCHQMYRRHSAVPENTATLARLWRCHPNKARRLLIELIEVGKIVRTDEGLSNQRVISELAKRGIISSARAEAGRKGGRARATKTAPEGSEGSKALRDDLGTVSGASLGDVGVVNSSSHCDMHDTSSTRQDDISPNTLNENGSPVALASSLKSKIPIVEKSREEAAAASTEVQYEARPTPDSCCAADGGRIRSPPSRVDLDRIERLCREAAGLENDPSPGLLNLAPILGLLDGGSDLEIDVVPALRSIARAGRKGRTWGYYVQPVIDFKKQRVKAANGAAAEGHASMTEPDEVRWRRMFEAWERGTWPDGWGPDPESAGCQIPSELIQQWSKRPGNAA